MKLLRCFKNWHGQLSNRNISESQERNTPTALHTYTVSYSYPESRTSRMQDFSTLLTPEGLPVFTQTFRQPKTPTPSRITSPKKVIIVNPANIRCLGVQSPIKTTCSIMPSMPELQKRLSQL
ncbi:AC4 [Melon chlorotic mosaic virus]|uniref:AC4 n=1 Tax=Melon chlorotic mosaic virus TaxID=180399 RepID=D9ZNQ0_9GEMI|nr:AC4 [Melon chlorotic mosaic virus]ADK97753.1 AC4 [Melon chlorotic mosaic virus]